MNNSQNSSPEKRCANEAMFLVHWPGKPTAMCAKHAEWADRVAKAMEIVLTMSISKVGYCECETNDKHE